MANLPATVAEALWIGSSGGQNHANVGEGQGTSSGAGDHIDYSQANIIDNVSPPIDANKFFLNSAGNVVFRINANAGTTSTNTKHPRTECRELQQNGTSLAAWDGRSSDEHWLKARCRIITVTSNRPWICFGQIHGSSTSPNTSDLIRLQTEGTNGTSTNLSLIARRTPPGGSEIRTVLKTGYNVGDWFDYEIYMKSGTITVSIDGTVVLTATGMGQIDNYFKFGCYLQDSVGEGASSSDWGAVEFQRGSVQVWHTGYPAPTTPVFTGGADSSGGPGQTGGVDTQAPSSPTNLTIARVANGNQLTWSPSTDNVGVHHYNVYRSGGGAGSGGSSSGTPSSFGKTDDGTGSTSSSADKIIASEFTAASGGKLVGGHARMWLDASGSTHARTLVYADSSGAPGALLATSDEITLTSTTADHIADFTFSGGQQITIAPATSYWLALAWADPGTPNVVYSRDSTTGARVERSNITYGTFPNPFSTPTGTFTGPIDVWADLNATGSSGGGTTTTTQLGKTTAGASFSASSADKTAVSKFTATTTGTLTAGHAHAWLSASGTANTKMVVYADSSGAPGALLASSDALSVTALADALQNYTFSGANQIGISSGTAYWIGLSWQDPGTPNLNLGRDSTASGRQEASSFTPNPFGTPSAQTGPVAAYVDVVSGSSASSGGSTPGYTLLGTSTTTSYLDTTAVANSGQTLGVGGVPAPAAGPNVTLITADSSSTLNITSPGTWDGGGHSVPKITIAADNVTVQNFVIHGGTNSGVYCIGDNVTVQNCDIYGILSDGDVNGVTFFGNGFKGLYSTIGVTADLVSGASGGSHTDGFQTWNTSTKRSSSNVTIQGNYVKGPTSTSNDHYIHQGVTAEGNNATSGGGGGTGDSTTWLIADNRFTTAGNQVLEIRDIQGVVITRNTFDGNATKIVNSADGSTTTYYTDNVSTGGTYPSGVGVSTTAGTGPTGPGGAAGGVPVVYSYLVTAVDAAGNESGSGSPGAGGGTGPDTTPPTTPTNLVASAGDQRVGLHWDASIDAGGIREYVIRRGGVAIGRWSSTSFVDFTAVNGTTYSYTVSAVDNSGNESPQSAATSATPTAGVVGGVAMLPGAITGGKLSVQIAWGADLSADAATWTWSDVTTDVRYEQGITTSLGRNDESTASNPAELKLILDNTAGKYSLGAISPHYPYVRRNTPVRLRIDPGDGEGGRVIFLGFADGWSPSWDALTGKIPVVALSASGTLRRLRQGAAPIQSAYRRAMTALGSAVAYWPLEEGKSATYAPPIRGGSNFTLAGGIPNWGSDSSFDCSDALPTLGKAHMGAAVTAYTDTGASQVRWLFNTPQNGLSDAQQIVRIAMTGTLARWDLTWRIVNGVSCLQVTRYNTDGSQNSDDIINFDAIKGVAGRMGFDWTQSGSNIVWTISFNPADATSPATFYRATLAGKTCGIVSAIDFNYPAANVSATVGHVTVQNAVTSFFENNNELVANAGEYGVASNGRLVRLCVENGVEIQTYGTGAALGQIDQMGPQLVAPLLTLLRECEVADQGQLWDGRTAGLSYTDRRKRASGDFHMIINAALGRLTKEFHPIDDDQRNRNRMTVSRLHGITVTYEDASGPLGTAAIGRYDDSITINNAYDLYMMQYARWFVLLGTVPGYRYPSVTVDVAGAPAFAAPALDMIPGGKITINNLNTTLAGFPDSTVDLMVEGIAHEITPYSWRVTFKCSPFAPWTTGLDGVSAAGASTALAGSGIVGLSTIG